MSRLETHPNEQRPEANTTSTRERAPSEALAMNLGEDVTKDDQGRDGRRSSVRLGNALGQVLPMKEEEEAILNHHHLSVSRATV